MQYEQRLWDQMVAEFAAENPSQIAHTQSVVDYTVRIAEGEGLPARQVYLLKLAALLHDIGCPAARIKHGRAEPVYQEDEGRRIVNEWFAADPLDLSREEISYLADVVGTHHKLNKAVEYHFMPLFEADLIVNFLEGYFPPEKLAQYRASMVKTATGNRLFDAIFVNWPK